MHQCIICLGSNYEAEKNINTALDRLENEFDIIEWGEAIYTPAEGAAKESTYLNRGAKLYTDKSAEEIKWLFKSIERLCGRTAESKKIGVMPLDIDLLIYDGEAIKPNDLTKAYVKLALKDLKI